MTRSPTRPNPTMHLQRPDQPPQPPPPGQPDPVRVRRALLAVGLVAVAVLSSFLWWLIRHEPETTTAASPGGEVPSEQAPAPDGSSEAPSKPSAKPAPTVQAGRFTFEGLAPTQVSRSCDKASYGKVSKWFTRHQCERVVRGLYAAEDGDARALVSISVVTMPTEPQAHKLKKITDTSGTGNVSDLLRDGSVRLPGAPEVAGGNYASNVAGNTLTIVESAFFGDTRNRALLDEITTTALQVGPEMR